MAHVTPGKASVYLAAIFLLAGCESTPRYSAPSEFTVSTDAVAQLVRDAVAGDRWAAQLEGSPDVNCTGRTSCTIRYTVQEAIGAIFHKEHVADEQLVIPTAQMWKAMFTDEQYQNGSITLQGPVNTAGGKTELATYFTLACDRAVASKINWDTVDGHSIRQQCNYRPQTRGLPGYG